MAALEPNEQRARIAIIFLWVILVLDIVSFISSYMQYDLLQTLASGEYVSSEAIEANNNRELAIGTFYSIASLISAVTFIMWFKRAYHNLHQKADSLLYTEGWTIGSWFVPIINLYRPYRIMKELYVKTKELLEKGGFLASYTTSYVNLWWAFWIISAFIGSFIFIYKTNTIDDYIAVTFVQIILVVLDVLHVSITVKVIKDYSEAETLLRESEGNLPLE
jgi:hypothetical protein